MARVKQTTVYKFDELNEQAKEVAREWYRQGALDYEWWDGSYDTAITAGRIIGIEIDKRKNGPGPAIYFQLDSGYGDGAAFQGAYRYVKGGLEALLKEFPLAFKDENGVQKTCQSNHALIEVAKQIQNAQRTAFYKLEARIAPRGRHDSDIEVRVYHIDSGEDMDGTAAAAALTEGLRGFSQWICTMLTQERDYRLSDKCVDEEIKVNEYEFEENGELA